MILVVYTQHFGLFHPALFFPQDGLSQQGAGLVLHSSRILEWIGHPQAKINDINITKKIQNIKITMSVGRIDDINITKKMQNIKITMSIGRCSKLVNAQKPIYISLVDHIYIYIHIHIYIAYIVL